MRGCSRRAPRRKRERWGVLFACQDCGACHTNGAQPPGGGGSHGPGGWASERPRGPNTLGAGFMQKGRGAGEPWCPRGTARAHHWPLRARTHTHAQTHDCQQTDEHNAKPGCQFLVSWSSNKTQSMFNASRRLSAEQGERRRHILHPFMKVSSPRQPCRALSRGPAKDRDRR